MYLKQLKIKGFKSFAENTEINFEPGITVVVGPNGCGKSNIADAIRWVLGEANVRQLRGLKQEDIIFNGTDHNRPLSMANVYITIDNSDNALPIEFSEVNIARKIFRSGESEFFINKNRVRLKDINALFTGTGIGKQSYAIIGQGELEKVLNGHAFGRRLILEEAAGIIIYRQERDEVKQRLATTENDLLRINDLLSEQKKQKDFWYEKEQKAQKYLALQEKLFALRKTVLACEIIKSQEVLTNKQQQFALNNNKLSITNNEINNIQEKLTDYNLRYAHVLEKADLLKKQWQQSNAIKRNQEAEQKLINERITNLQTRILQAQKNQQNYHNLLAKINQDILINQENFAKEAQALADKKLLKEDLQQKLAELKNMLAKKTAGLDFYKPEKARQANLIDNLQEKIIQNKEQYQKLQVKYQQLQFFIQENFQSKNTINQKIMQFKGELKDLSDTIQAANINHAAVNKELNIKSLIYKETQQHVKTCNEKLMQMENRLSTLQQLDKNLAFYSEGVRNLLKAYQNGEKSLQGIRGTVGDLIQVSPGLELALETTLGKSLENIVVDTSKNAEQAINYLKVNKMGRATFLPINMLRDRNNIPENVKEKIISFPGVIGMAVNLVSYEPYLKKVINYLLDKVVVMEDLSGGIKLFKDIKYSLRIVTLDGDLLNSSGAISGGLHKKSSQGLLKKRYEKIKLQQTISVLKKEREALKIQEQQDFEMLTSTEKQLRDIKQVIKEEEMQRTFLEKQLTDLYQHLKEIQAKNSSYERELGLHSKEQDKLQKLISENEEQVRVLEEQYQSYSKDMAEQKEALEAYLREYELNEERVNSLGEQIVMQKKEVDNIQKHINQFAQVKKSYHQSLQEIEQQIAVTKQELDLQNKNRDQLIQDLALTEEGCRVINAELGQIEIQAGEYQELVEKQKELQLPLQKQAGQLDQQLRGLELQKIRLELEYNNLLQKWQEDFQSSFQEDFVADINKNEIKNFQKLITQYSAELEMLGSIDINAIEEYQAISQRFEFINRQYEDLNLARRSLQKILQDTEKLMDDCFYKFFQQANASFKSTFSRIFNGGEASLQLQDEVTDPLAGGIDIMVKMPGKRAQNMNLLSGGERALTCIAFIFALLTLKPVPFCLLDEIDAALDEINLLRFADFVNHMAQNNQFIIISHRQATIACASKVYGITMPQQGISKVLSLDLQHIEELLESDVNAEVS